MRDAVYKVKLVGFSISWFNSRAKKVSTYGFNCLCFNLVSVCLLISFSGHNDHQKIN